MWIVENVNGDLDSNGQAPNKPPNKPYKIYTHKHTILSIISEDRATFKLMFECREIPETLS